MCGCISPATLRRLAKPSQAAAVAQCERAAAMQWPQHAKYDGPRVYPKETPCPRALHQQGGYLSARDVLLRQSRSKLSATDPAHRATGRLAIARSPQPTGRI